MASLPGSWKEQSRDAYDNEAGANADSTLERASCQPTDGSAEGTYLSLIINHIILLAVIPL